MTDSRKRRLAGVILACGAAWLAIGITAQGAASCSGGLGLLGWQCETVDASGDLASLSQAAYAPDGTLHVAYNQNLGSKGNTSKTALKYVRRSTSAVWTTPVTIDNSVGEPQAMLINPVTNRPAIAYSCLQLAEFSGTAWTIQTVVPSRSCDTSWSNGAGFAADGTMFVAYSENKKSQLVVGTRHPGTTTWSFETLTTTSWLKSLAVDPFGRPAVATFSSTNPLVFVSKQANGTWSTSTVPDTPTSTNPALRFDGSGAPTIAYRNGSSMIRFARLNPAGTWTIETVASMPSLSALSLAYANGEPVVTFDRYDQASGRYVLMISRRDGTSGTWLTSSVDPSSNAGGAIIGTSTAYDALHGVVGISYGPRDVVKALKFAEGSPLVIGQ